MRRAAVAFALAAACVALLRAQQDMPVFRAQVDAIEIDAFVTDAQGNPVTSLTIDDFELLEDGQPQRVTSFAVIDIPVDRVERPLYSPTAIEPDVSTNRGGEGRLYVIAVDEVRPDLALRTRHFLRRFVEQHFGDNDVAALIYVGRGRTRDTQDFTSSRRRLLAAIDGITGGFTRDAVVEPPPAEDPDAADGPAGANPEAQVQAQIRAGIAENTRDALAREDQLLTRARMRSLRELLEFVGSLRGRRKTMVYVTERLTEATTEQPDEGVYGVLDYAGGTRSIAFGDLHAALTAATRGNVSIYPVDPTGLSPGGALGDATAAPTAARGLDLNRMQELRALAEATGGFAFVNSNSIDAAFARIVRENSAYYLLGFTSTNDRRDGRYRRMEVRVRRPGLQVRARNGYVAPLEYPQAPNGPDLAAASLAPGVAAAIGVPMGNTAVPMAVFAAPFKGPGSQANVLIAAEFDASRLGLVDTGGTLDGEIEVAAVAIDADGTTHAAERQRARLALLPDTYKRALSSSIRTLTQIALPPGRYQLRVAGGNITGRAGSVMADLDVPDFAQDPLVMSGVAMTSAAAAQAPTAAPQNPLAGVLPAPATAMREFARNDRLTLYAEVYDNVRNVTPHTVGLMAELRSDEGRVVQTVQEQRSSTERQGASLGYGFRADLRLDVDPGIYVIHVEARADIADQPTVSRDIQIRVK